MEIIKSVKQLQQTTEQLRQSGKRIGFVPTMGYLHEGHQALMEKARNENDMVIVSIFVNPLQFGPGEDFDTYPRDEKRDIQIAKENQVDILFLPSTEDMYPDEQAVTMRVVRRVDALCGKSRKGHFDGVVAVLTKLFHLAQSHRVYFGMKDAQQVAVVDALVKDFNFPLEIVPVATVREEDGLAKSSRNVYLSNQERREAKELYQALLHGRQLIVDGEKNPDTIVKEVEDFINKRTHGKIDYVELLTYPELTTTTVIQRQVILAIAVHFEKARLIDNLVFGQNGFISEGL
ncbi:pantoate--beta-alanine ligase [Sediminibacillus dalangtanensis]|uniref:Pantothenate synthetase n=1 Tax=Sediminibacillus dalangtanensis TaxID=2729421 RepID=A0ABX7VRS6_9BACI|nr:pantoate--beta-alanine ligase [Sediminibacillus dalangtanensis]QTM99632.1 pantoate--beta-alanine ligase [Sediminibacillus dalangtanensis]